MPKRKSTKGQTTIYKFWLFCLGLLVFSLPKDGFPVFWPWEYLMKVIPETRRVTKLDISIFIHKIKIVKLFAIKRETDFKYW